MASNMVSGSSVKFPVPKIDRVSAPFFLIKSRRTLSFNTRRPHLLVAESDRLVSDRGESSNPDRQSETSVANESKQDNKMPSSADVQSSMQKKAPLTARERLRAARVLSRYSESKPSKSEIGRSVMDALRESEKGKKGLPQAPTNLFDDSKRGMPKAGLTFDFPGGSDLFLIVLSFVLISTVMFATTYIVWKVGAIHFNEY